MRRAGMPWLRDKPPLATARLIGALTVAPLLGLGLAATPAAHATTATTTAGKAWVENCGLTIRYEGKYSGKRYYRVSISASSHIHWGLPLKQYRVYGQDDGPDQFLFSWSPSRSYAIVSGSLLNEDSSFYNRDEIYATCVYYNQSRSFVDDSNLVEAFF